mmetsp:Transcript_38621/g.62766  ORF Transcript_38621/g.62766 Transcript_38621/m.62766 type:complete len:82 (+) Transcript_38621:1873-2118(+)
MLWDDGQLECMDGYIKKRTEQLKERQYHSAFVAEASSSGSSPSPLAAPTSSSQNVIILLVNIFITSPVEPCWTPNLSLSFP